MKANARTSRPAWHRHPAHDGAGPRAQNPCRVWHGHPARVRAAGRGFTLIEMLMAMFILAIGLSAVVSVFYAAASLQRAAFDDVSGMQVARNAEALLTGRGIEEFWLVANGAFLHPSSAVRNEWDEGQVVPLNPEMLRSGSQPVQRWPLSTRAYPQVDPFAELATRNPDVVEDPEAVDRDYYWVPLVRNASGTPDRHDWQVFVFVVRKVQDRYDYDPLPWGGFILANPDHHPNSGQLNDSLPEGGGRPIDPRIQPGGLRHIVPGVWGLPASRVDDEWLAVDHLGYISVGDRVLIGTGVTGRVVEAETGQIRLNTRHGVAPGDGTRVWIGGRASPRSSSPTRFILTLGGEVVR